MDPAFEGAGQSEGLQIWRIENFEVVAYPPEKYGQFYEGDSYIVLYTEIKGSRTNWFLHFWLGKTTSLDESGTAAIKAVELDDALGGVPVQYRETQGNESALFTCRFKSGVRYLKGGVSSGFVHVDPDEPHPARLFHVKGRRNVRVIEVEVSADSLNSSDCFVLDVDRTVYVYMGVSSRRVERLRATTAATGIRDTDHAGKAKVLILDESADEEEYAAFFEALGGGSLEDVKAEEEIDDETYETQSKREVSLHHVWEEDGEIHTVKVGGTAPKQCDLKSEDCFLLDTGRSGVFVWIGKTSSKEEKKKSMELAAKYLEENGYPPWTKVQRIVEGAETMAFKQYFSSWRDDDDTCGLGRAFARGQVAASVPVPEFDVSRLHGDSRKMLLKHSPPAVAFMPDDGSGQVQMFRVEDFELEAVDPSCHGNLFGGDSYVIKYTYDEGAIIYFWQGGESSQDEKAAAAIHAVRLDNEMNGVAVQVRVCQGAEPAHFLRMFGGRLVIHSGGKASGFKNRKDLDSYDVDGTRLFQVRGTGSYDVRAMQVPEVSASLNSDDCFVLETPEKTYLWLGKESSEDEKQMGETLCGEISPGREICHSPEGEEEDAFWEALGGSGEYTKISDDPRPGLAERLFHCHVSPAGVLRVVEVAGFTQQDLNTDDVMILDTGDEIYVWIGEGASDEEKTRSWQLAQDYIASDPSPRTPTTVVFMKVSQGSEAPAFKACFPSWNPNMWQEIPSYETVKASLAESNALLE